MEGNANAIAAIVMGGVLLTAIAWKVLDLAMHAMTLDRAGDDDTGPTRTGAGGDDPDARH
jgi:hypothetical protein